MAEVVGDRRRTPMIDTLLLVDVLSDFKHDDGERLRAVFVDRLPALATLVKTARGRGTAVVYANDNAGDWSADRSTLLRRAREGADTDVVEQILPRPSDPVILKPRYSAFDQTPIRILLNTLGTERILLAGTALEMCVAQTAIDAREQGFKVSVMIDACATLDPANAEFALAYLERVVGVWIERDEPNRTTGGSRQMPGATAPSRAWSGSSPRR
jgi:nicotinamidase-related amidase